MSIESFYTDMEIRKRKHHLVCTYKPIIDLISNHLKNWIKTWAITCQNMKYLFSLVISIRSQQNQQIEIFVKSKVVRTFLTQIRLGFLRVIFLFLGGVGGGGWVGEVGGGWWGGGGGGLYSHFKRG